MLSKLSVKKPYTVIVGIILAIVLGVIAFQKMSTDLLPSMNLPYVVVYTTYPGATPEQVESEVTRPMEASFATLTDIKKLTSQSRDNVSVVIMQFNDGANMDTALIEISSQLDQLKGTWDDDVGSPVALKLNPDMLPVTILSVAREDMDILALSDYVNDELVPAFEGLNGVASANVSGAITQEIDVTIEQSRIDVVNSAILKDIDKELSKVEDQLNEAQAQISDGKRQLARAKAEAYEQLDQAEAQLAGGQSQMKSAIVELEGQRTALQAQRDELATQVTVMEAAMNMTDDQKAAVQAAATQLAALKQQREALQTQLNAALQSGDEETLKAARADAQSQRDALVSERDAQLAYIDDLALTDAAALNADIAELDGQIDVAEAELSAAKAELNDKTAKRDALKADADALADDIASRESATEAPAKDAEAAEDADTPAPETATPAPEGGEDEATQAPEDDITQPPETGEDEVTPTPAEDVQTEEPAEDGQTEEPAEDGQTETPAGDEATAAPTSGSETEAPDEETPTTAPTDDGAQTEAPAENTENGASSDNGGTDAPSDDSEPETSVDSGESRSTEENNEAPAETHDSENNGASGQNDSENNGASGQRDSESDGASGQNDSENNGASGQRDSESDGASGQRDSESDNASGQRDGESDGASGKRDSASDDAPANNEAPERADADVQAARLWLRALAEDSALSELKARQETVQAQLSAAETGVSGAAEAVSAKEAEIADLKARREAKVRALDAQTDTSADVESRRAEAQARVAALDGRIGALDQEIAAIDARLAGGGGDAEALAQQLEAMDQQIAALESSDMAQAVALLSDPDGLTDTYAQAKAGLAEMDAGLETLDTTLTKLNDGIIPGGFLPGVDKDTKLLDAMAEIGNARAQMDEAFAQAGSMLSKAEKELAKARKEFMEKREDAFKDAGLDGVITVQMVAGLIGAQNISMPAGYVKDLSEDQVLVRVGDKFGSIDELKRMKLFDLDLDSIDEVRLLDVASVELTDDRDDVFTKLDGRDGILLSLEKQSTYSTADVAKTIMAKVEELQQETPGLEIIDLMNQGEYIDIVVDSVLGNLLSGGALAILILLLFLLDWRPTLTVAFSIPISVVAAFVCMYFTGITLNVLSLSGLSLGIGMLVDNSIVSIENIYRLHDEEGLPPLRACVQGVSTVAGALFSSTLTTICVFLPIVFVQGMARDLFSDMGLTIAYSLLASLLVAMTVVPMMTSFLMRRTKPKKHAFFSKIQAGYASLLRGALRVKPLVLLAALALLVFSGMQVTKMGISFMPEVNSRQMSADLTPDPELSEAEQKAQAAQIMDEMLEIPGIASIGLMDGSGTLLSSGGGFSYYINVDQEAGVKNADIVRQIDAIGEKHHADLTAQASTMDISVMTGSGISVEITGDDIDTLQAIAGDVAELVRQTEGTTDVDDGLEDAVPELRVTVDKEKAIDNGLTTGQVLQFIAQKLAGKAEVTKVTLDGKELAIQLIEGRNKDLRPADIQDLEIEVEKEEEDTMVRIGDIADISDATSLSTISRASQRRMVTVSFAIADGYSANLVSNAFEEKLRAYDLPEGYKAELAGENETVMGIMEDLVWMILVAVLLIFLIMVAQFQSFKSPIIVMFTIPLAFTGGLLALILTGMDLSIVSMLGFLVLSGVVVNNGIVFIDCVNQLRIEGWEKRDALVEAGRQRLRPILMTAMTTILGMSTMALGHGTGAEMMQPMAVVSIGGLTYATLMTLFVVPVMYDLFNGRTMKAREIQMIKEAAGMNGDEVLDDGKPTPPAPAAPVEASVAEEPPVEVKPAEPAAEPEVPPVPVFAPRPEPAPVGKPIRIKLKR